MNATLEDLQLAGAAELKRLLRGGHAIDPAALWNMEFRGLSLGLPPIAKRVLWRHFRKVFVRDTDQGVLRGWNVRTHQDERCEPVLRAGRPVTFGHFQVIVPAPAGEPGLGAHGAVLDYGPYHRWYHPLARLRDPLVAVQRGSSELLLGWSYVGVAGLRLGLPSFFALLRDRPLTHHEAPPVQRR